MKKKELVQQPEEMKNEEKITETVQEEKIINEIQEESSLPINNETETREDDKIFKQKQIKQKSDKKKLIILITATVIICAILFFSIIFSLLNLNNQKMVNGLSIMGIDVSNLTINEAKEKLNNLIEDKFQDDITLNDKETQTSINASQFNAKFDIDSAVTQAYNIGKDGNIITNNYAILLTNIFHKNIEAKLYYDEELLNKTIEDINLKLKDVVTQSSYYIEDNDLIIVKGKAGNTIQKDNFKEQIFNNISNLQQIHQEITIPTTYVEPDAIHIEKIRNEIYKEPKDAYVEKNPVKIHTHVDGVDFGITIEEAKKIVQENKEEYTIPLKITKAKKTISDLGEEAFPEQLSTFSTIYDASNKNRSNNIELATKKINGTVIMPGESFSYNKTVGKRTLEAGFKEGTAYVGGKVVPDVGGGICQLSSTLYNTVLLANLEVTERSNHLFLTSYVAAGRDATVYYGSLDFVFKNTKNYPIKIVASSKNGVCKVSFYGIKEETEYEVVIQSKINSYINYTVKYKEDSTLEKGKEVVEQSGANGCRSEAYKILKLNGKVVSKTLLSKDTYSPMERIVRKGTKAVATKPTNTDTPEASTQT